MSNGWNPERKAKQAQAVKRWQPWKYSTGPVSEEGKARASRNAWKGGKREKERVALRDLMALVTLKLPRGHLRFTPKKNPIKWQ